MSILETIIELGHPINCTCETCWRVDSSNIMGAHPHSHWTSDKLDWILSWRARPLNWTFEPGHCAACGGTTLAASVMYEHFQFKPYNVQVVNGITYMSWLFANDSGYHASYVSATKKGKEFLRDWAARCILGSSISPDSPNYYEAVNQLAKSANKIAVREVDRAGEIWTEIRIGFKYELLDNEEGQGWTPTYSIQ